MFAFCQQETVIKPYLTLHSASNYRNGYINYIGVVLNSISQVNHHGADHWAERIAFHQNPR